MRSPVNEHVLLLVRVGPAQPLADHGVVLMIRAVAERGQRRRSCSDSCCVRLFMSVKILTCSDGPSAAAQLFL